ncbi:MAG: hypothetical protein HZB39_14525 [Planctomycetes bacterium]|nr:hypothetical protein [Planctomycetota bacterium]
MLEPSRFPALALLALLGACTAAPAHRVDVARIEHDVENLLAGHGSPVRAGLWLGDARSALWSRDAERAMPAASAIKTAFLVEWFAEHAAGLDERPSAFAALCADTTHPAFTHFEAPLRSEIARDLSHASVREVGRAMIRGTGVSNGVYNAAANLVTAALDGPAALTARIHARDPAFASIHGRRYMLAARNAGDNEASPASLAAVLQRIAGGDLAGVDDATLAAIRDVMRGRDDPRFGAHWQKSGALDTDPITRVESGCFPLDGTPLVYVVMLAQDDAGTTSAAEAGARLGRLALALRDLMLESVAVRSGTR